MPWSISKQDGKFCVVKDTDGSVEKCHATEAEAKDHMKALYASEKDKTEPGEAEVKMMGPDLCIGHPPAGCPTSDACEHGPYLYSEWRVQQDAIQAAARAEELAYLLPTFVMRIFQRPDVENKMAALERLTTEFTQEMRKAVGSEMKEAGEETTLFKRFKEFITKTPMKTASGEKSPAGDLMVWKEADGQYHWTATYSNNYRDQDNPPEIIAAKSHKRFDDLLTKGEAPMPHLWLWHVPEWEWGVATWHAYDDLGFPVAGGTVHKGCELLAEAIAADPGKWAVSHGMPRTSIVRDPGDPSVIVEHITSEISPLPAYAAANKGTGFSIIKEAPDMAIPQEKRVKLTEDGLDPSVLDAVEAANAERAEAQAGTEQKEKDRSPTDKAEPDPVEAEPAQEAAPAISSEVTEAFTAVMERLGEIQAQLDVQAKELTALKEADATKVARAVEETPAASLADLIRGTRAVGSDETRIDGRTSLAKAGPAEAEAKDTTPPLSPIPFLNQLVAPRQ